MYMKYITRLATCSINKSWHICFAKCCKCYLFWNTHLTSSVYGYFLSWLVLLKCQVDLSIFFLSSYLISIMFQSSNSIFFSDLVAVSVKSFNSLEKYLNIMKLSYILIWLDEFLLISFSLLFNTLIRIEHVMWYIIDKLFGNFCSYISCFYVVRNF